MALLSGGKKVWTKTKNNRSLKSPRLKILRFKGSKLRKHLSRLSFCDDFVDPFPHRPKMFSSFFCLQHRQGVNSTESFLKRSKYIYFYTAVLLWNNQSINLCLKSAKPHPQASQSTLHNQRENWSLLSLLYYSTLFSQTMYACLLQCAVGVNTGGNKIYLKIGI